MWVYTGRDKWIQELVSGGLRWYVGPVVVKPVYRWVWP